MLAFMYFITALHQSIIVALHLDLLFDLGLCLLAPEYLPRMRRTLSTRLSMRMCDSSILKGLARKASAPLLRSLQIRFSTSLFEVSKMTGISLTLEFAFDLLEQCDAIHFRHHHVADNKVVLTGEQRLESFLAVEGIVKSIPVTYLLGCM